MTFFARTIPILALILGSASAGTTTTWTIYANDACTEICPFGSVEACSTTIDTTKDCNQNLESSQSDVACSATKVTYINYPNTGTNSGSEGCPSDGQSFTNEIAVGECVEFPGPVTTWKMIEADTYDCGDDSNNENPTTASPTKSNDDSSPQSSAGTIALSIVAGVALPLVFYNMGYD